jgi:hypothetical protein
MGLRLVGRHVADVAESNFQTDGPGFKSCAGTFEIFGAARWTSSAYSSMILIRTAAMSA